MATNITKILPEELDGKGVVGMDDAPELSTLDMQYRFEEIVRDVVIPHINGMADEIDAAVDGVAADLADEVTRAKAAERDLETAIGQVDTKVGDLENLTTTDKTNIVSAINEVDGNVDTEVERATGAETTITNRIDALGLSVAGGKLCITYNA